MKVLKVRDTGKNWYTAQTVTVVGQVYDIIDVEWNGLLSYWVLKVKRSK